MGRSLLKMSNDELYESSLRFLFKQLDLYVEMNQPNKSKSKYNSGNNNESKEDTKYYKVLD